MCETCRVYKDMSNKMLQIGRIYKYIFTNTDIVYMLVTDYNEKIITGIMFDSKYEFDSMFTIDIKNKERMESVGYIYGKDGLGLKLYFR